MLEGATQEEQARTTESTKGCDQARAAESTGRRAASAASFEGTMQTGASQRLREHRKLGASRKKR